MKKKICIILIVVFVALFSTSAYFIFDHYRQEAQQAELYDSLADMVDCAADTEEEPAEPVLYTEEKTVLPELAELYQQNGDLAGWIRIEDTNINYPVMHTPDNPDFYLKHGFDKEYSDYGCPYVQENCDVKLPSDNVIIYGHHIKGGRMFGVLENYKDKEFYEKHRIIQFDTLKERGEYEIVSVFKTVAYNPEGYRYYDFVDAEHEREFAAYVEKCKEIALYDTGVTAEYGDRLITLSTCEYSAKNGRLVVVAKRIN